LLSAYFSKTLMIAQSTGIIARWLKYLRISENDYAARLRNGLLAVGLPDR
jgi:hypothetical protein